MPNCKVCGSEFILNRAQKLYCSKFCREKNRRTSPKRKEQMKAWRRKSDLKNKYKLSIEDYEIMCAAQKGLCALCERPPREGRKLHVDHCHTTGRVRGLLCAFCNYSVIGNKTIDYFVKCLEYLKEPRVEEA